MSFTENRNNKRLLDSPESTQSPKTTRCSTSENMNSEQSSPEDSDESHNLNDNTDIVVTLRKLLSEELGKERKTLLDELDARFAPVALKSDIQPMQEKLETLIIDNSSTKNAISILQEKVNKFEETAHLQSRKLESLERKQRSRNLIFLNVDKNANSSIIEAICRDLIKASMTKVVVARTQILKVRNELATVLVSFKDEEAISEIFANIKNLKGSKIRVDYDLSPDLRARRNVLMALKKEILSKNTTIKTFVRQDNIKIGDKRLVFRDGHLLEGSNDAREFLLTNFDINFDIFLEKFITEGKRNSITA